MGLFRSFSRHGYLIPASRILHFPPYDYSRPIQVCNNVQSGVCIDHRLVGCIKRLARNVWPYGFKRTLTLYSRVYRQFISYIVLFINLTELYFFVIVLCSAISDVGDLCGIFLPWRCIWSTVSVWDRRKRDIIARRCHAARCTEQITPESFVILQLK